MKLLIKQMVSDGSLKKLSEGLLFEMPWLEGKDGKVIDLEL